MTSSSSTIIRIPRTDTDQEDDFILGEVTHSGGSSARGSKPLNLKIVATEGEEPYALTRKYPGISSLFSLFRRYLRVYAFIMSAAAWNYYAGASYPAVLMLVVHNFEWYLAIAKP